MKREKQLLIVEDDEELRNTIVNSLNRTGLRAFGVSSLRDARARLRLQTYDLVLIDIHLGDDRSDELIRELRERQDSLNKDTPILVISGFLDRDLIGSLRPYVQGALVKPFSLNSVLDQVKALTQGSPAA